MINKIIAPRETANDETLVILNSLISGTAVSQGQKILEVEGSKTVIDIESPADGYYHSNHQKGDTVEVGSIIAIISKNRLLEDHETRLLKSGINQDSDAISQTEIFSQLTTHQKLFNPSKNHSANRLAVIGAGRGLAQVIEILNNNNKLQLIGSYDDKLWNNGDPRTRLNYPLLGPINTEVILRDYKSGLFDSLIIAISTSISFREKWFNELSEQGILFPNLIHPNVAIDPTSSLGEGNIILPNCHIGPFAKVGNNNFISGFSNIEHHCSIGNHNTFGPAVILSGSVRIGQRNKFGTGIYIEPNLYVADDCTISSGSIITKSINQDKTILKNKITTK